MTNTDTKKQPTPSRSTASRQHHQGFTLLELSIVLLVVGFILGGLLIPLSSQLHNARVETTEDYLQEARQALIGFALANSRLPCPDTDNDGLENPPPCNDVEGHLPWATLGLKSGDAWGRAVRYRADDNYTQASGIPDPADTSSGLTIENRNNDVLSNGNPDAAAAVLWSCGDNGKPEAENDADGGVNSDALCSNPGTPDAVYTRDDYVKDIFDDIVWVLSKNVLIYKLAAAGKWP